MRISDWSSDVCSSDLPRGAFDRGAARIAEPEQFRRLVERFARGIVDRGGEAAIDTNAADQQQLAMPARDEQQQIGEGEVGVGEARAERMALEIGRASCRERVCQYV